MPLEFAADTRPQDPLTDDQPAEALMLVATTDSTPLHCLFDIEKRATNEPPTTTNRLIEESLLDKYFGPAVVVWEKQFPPTLDTKEGIVALNEK